jgi:glucose-6-phosphate-specific signal transduction histidine kinase
MDFTGFISVLQESLFMVVVFLGFLMYAMSSGRQAVTNLILGLYFALLISIEFPYYTVLIGGTSSVKTESIVMLIVFAVFTLGATILFARLMPREYAEKKFEGFWKKLLLASAATVLVMSFSYHALPVTEIINPGGPIQYLFASSQSFFYWLIAPIIVLYIT